MAQGVVATSIWEIVVTASCARMSFSRMHIVVAPLASRTLPTVAYRAAAMYAAGVHAQVLCEEFILRMLRNTHCWHRYSLRMVAGDI